jgi:branched-chain amino acid transport system substrate-binding protein
MLRLRPFDMTTRLARGISLSTGTRASTSLRRWLRCVTPLAACLPTLALAQVKIGLVLSLTGPAASLGIPARDTVALFPKELAGQKV